MGSDPQAVYRFDRYTLDLIRGALLGPGGVELSLRPKSFALLRYLVTHAGRLVDRDELMQAVWPNVFVTDDSIAQCVKDIRRALGDDAQRLLRTLPRRGYLLTAAAECAVPAAVGDRPRPPALVAEAASPSSLPVPTANRPMLVVLPFENQGGDPTHQYLASGLTVDLVTDLTPFEAMHVVSPPAYARLSLASGSSTPGWTIPEQASFVLSGSVRRADGRIRVSVRLDDALSGITLWGERFDRPVTELMALQDELVERLPSHLVAQIERAATRRLRRRPPASLDAYDLCLQGRDHHYRVSEPDTLIARKLFERSIEVDPGYASAYAWLAYAVQRGFTWQWGEPRGREATQLAVSLARRGVDLEPESSLCLGRLSLALMLNHDWDEALETGRAAVQANHCLAESRYDYGDVLAHAGGPAEAERELRLAHSLNPFHPPQWHVPLSRALIRAGRWEEALTELHFCRARLPSYIPCLQSLAAAALQIGRVDEARAAVAAMMRDNPGLTIRSCEERMFFRDPTTLELHRAGLRAGGMPVS